MGKFSKLKELICDPYILLLLSGLLLDVSFFVHSVFAQFIAFFSIAPALYAVTKLEYRQRYLGGLVFFASWLIPTTYWYYNFMPVWVALLASFGIVALISNVFLLSKIIKKRNVSIDFLVIILSWTLFTAIRIELPFTENWWIPHIAYTQWLNPTVVQIASFASIYGIVFFILLVNAVFAYLFIKSRYLLIAVVAFVVISSSLLGNFFLRKTIGSGVHRVAVLSIQAMPSQGVYSDAVHRDVVTLETMTTDSLNKIKTQEESRPIIIVWPENMIESSEDDNISRFVQGKKIYLVYNRKEVSDGKTFNTVVMLDPAGDIVSTTFKRHAAPGEDISTKNQKSSAKIGNIKTATDVCYDLHYPDVRERTSGKDLLIAPVDDDRYGSFMPYLHAADIVFRAVENRIYIATAATSGPTFFVNRYGVIEKGPLLIYEKNVLFMETSIGR